MAFYPKTTLLFSYYFQCYVFHKLCKNTKSDKNKCTKIVKCCAWFVYLLLVGWARTGNGKTNKKTVIVILDTNKGIQSNLANYCMCLNKYK